MAIEKLPEIENRNGEQYIGGHRIVDPIKYKWRVLIGCFMGQAFDILDLMAIALALPLIINQWGINLVSAGSIATMTLIGSALGAYSWGPIMDRFGRKKVYILCLVWMSVFSGVCAWATNVEQLLVLRFLAGFALGGLWVMGSTMLNEFTPTEWRAWASAFVQSASLPGYGGVLLINLFIVPTHGWQPLFLVAFVGLLFAAYMAVAVPESPAWIKQKYGLDKGSLKAAAEGNGAAKYKTRDLFRAPFLKPLLLAAGLVISFIVSYWGLQAWTPTYLVQEAGVSSARMSYIMLSMNVGGFFGYYLSGWVATKIGRRENYLYGCTLAGLTMILFIYVATPATVMYFSFLLGLISFGYIGSLAVFIGEQFPTALRASGISFAWGAGRTAAALVPTLLGGLAMAFSLKFAIGLMGFVCAAGSICAFFMRNGEYTDNA